MDSNLRAVGRQRRNDCSVTRVIPSDDNRHKWVSWWMLFSERAYVIDKIKDPLRKAIIGFDEGTSWIRMLIALIQMVRIAKRYPEPTKENTSLHHTHILMDVSEKFFKNEKNPGRASLFKALWRMFIIQYEHDAYYTDRIDWIVGELAERGWGVRPMKFPMNHWEEDDG